MEASVSTDWGEFDVVALAAPPDAPDRLADVIDRYRDWMRRLNACLLRGFETLGVPFGRSDADEMLATWRPGPAGGVQGEVRLPNLGLRPWLLAHEVISAEAEYGGFFGRALSAGGGRPPLPRCEEVLPRFQELGAVLIVAHPKRFLAANGEAGMDALIAQTGADGVEAGHASHTPAEFRQYRDYARGRGLLVSGGSDVHFHADLPELGRHGCDESDAAPLLARLGR